MNVTIRTIKKRTVATAAILVVIFTFTGCARMRNLGNPFGYGKSIGGSNGPGHYSPGSEIDGVDSDTPSLPTSPFQSGGGSDVFGGNMSSPARGFQGGFGR